jgi:alpha-amylase/alpha-mannosidase (GH57 family)
MKWTRSTISFLACSQLLCGCPPATTPDAGVDAGPGATAVLVRAFTGDGTVLHAYFSEAVTPLEADVRVFAADAGQAVTVSAIAPDPSDTQHVVVTLSAKLPTDRRYQLAFDRVTTGAPQPLKTTLSLAMVWHQHQPSYVDPLGDYLRGPWVRKHGTKDYYDMAASLEGYPDIHVMVNLTPILLMQLEDYYLKRVGPYVDLSAKTVDTTGYFSQRTQPSLPVTDAWLDMLLTDTPEPAALSEEQKGWYYKDIWSNFSISDVIIERWPAYKALRTKRGTAPDTVTKDDLLQLKGYFQLAWFDPRFLKGPVTLTDGSVVDLSDLVSLTASAYALKRPLTEADCRRLVVEEYKILNNIVGAHRKLLYEPTAKSGQIEVMTTPFYHPILPLLADTELAKRAMATSTMPSTRFQHPEDAQFHVAQAARTFQQHFGQPVTGMWPAEGSVAEEVVSLFAQNGVKWIATDRLVLERSTPASQPIYSPYRIDSDTVVGDGGDATDELAVIFRDTSISDKIGFQYQGGTPTENVTDFLESLRRHSPDYGDERLLSIILDGENAWEWYSKDEDAIGFLDAMYAALTRAQTIDEFRTVTVSEYLSGNAARKVSAHPTHGLPELEPLFAGSWIAGSFSTWIGEDEENLAWDYLTKVRSDLALFETQGLTKPALDANPTPGTAAWHASKAWQAMYAAEGSDWFWWYGADQTASGGDQPFDRIYLGLLTSVYQHAKDFGINTTVPSLVPILRYCEPPHGPMTSAPTIDGAFVPDDGNDASKPNEWTQKGSGACADIDSSVGVSPDDVLTTYYLGQDSEKVYLALRMSATASTRLGASWLLRLYFSHRHIKALGPPVEIEQDESLTKTRLETPLVMQAGGAARELELTMTGSQLTQATLSTVVAGAWQATGQSVTVQGAGVGDVIELAIPKVLLNYQLDDPLEMVVTAVSGTTEVDRAPNLNAVLIHSDRSRMVEVTFVADCTGNRLPLTKVKNIDNPPPPTGTGRVFIVGNLPETGNWAPNTIPMFDDGTNGDETAQDNFWTFRMLVPPMTSVQYKYTIGITGQSWGATEEYPLTNRGFVAADENGDGKVVIHDVFADRPEPSGSLPGLTQMTNK